MQVKTVEIDGYNAIQLGYDDVKTSYEKKPDIGHADAANTKPKKFIREMRLPSDSQPEYKIGDSIKVSVFKENEYVDIVGTNKGKGFAGVMKRHGFAGFPASHGTERKHRAPGSIASFGSERGRGSGPKKVRKWVDTWVITELLQKIIN